MASKLNKSPVSKFFFTVDTVDDRKAVYNECIMSISRGGTSAKNFTTTNLIAGACFQPTLQKCASMKEVWPIDHPRAQVITTVIGEMMALDYQPFSVVQDEGFKRLMKLVAPKWVISDKASHQL